MPNNDFLSNDELLKTVAEEIDWCERTLTSREDEKMTTDPVKEAGEALIDLLDRRDTMRAVGRPYDEYCQQLQEAAEKFINLLLSSQTAEVVQKQTSVLENLPELLPE